MSAFEQLGVQPWLTKQCAYMALTQPTPIQTACIPAVLRGSHVVGGAATGSGKTAAFALPILQALSADVYGVFALVLTPSRELAYQIADQFIALGAALHVRTMLAIGGVRHEEQVDALKSRPPVVVATPGRLLHLLHTFQQEVRPAFKHLRFFVLDEADRLTEGDISRDVRSVMEELPPTPKRQVLMFTATLEPRLTQRAVTGVHRKEADVEEDGEASVPWLELLGVHPSPRFPDCTTPLVVCDLAGSLDGAAVGPSSAAAAAGEAAEAAVRTTDAGAASTVTLPAGLSQTYVFIPDMVKLPNLVAALRAQGKDQTTIVFANSCMRVELVRLSLQLLGFPVASLDSLLTQQHRLDNLALFKLGLARILVATDIASRGLDIPSVSAVMHYDVPKHATTYVHRVGRTARAGREGLSVAFVTEHDVPLVQRLEKKLGVRLKLWKESALREQRILKLLDEVSAAKVQARQQVSEQFGNRASTLKAQAVEKKAFRSEQQRHQTSSGPAALGPSRSAQKRARARSERTVESTGATHSPSRRSTHEDGAPPGRTTASRVGPAPRAVKQQRR